MRRCLIILFLAGTLCGGLVPALRAAGDPDLRAVLNGFLPSGDRQGGETIGDAVGIPSLPFSDQGSTVGFRNDYDVACPDSAWAADVVYSYAPGVNDDHSVTAYPARIDLCSADYDSKVYVFQDDTEHPVACNDDACGEGGTRSLIENVFFEPFHTYYIVIDGHQDADGGYEIEAEPEVPCTTCPPGAMQENEPPLSNEYQDRWNGGCNSNPPVFERIAPQFGGCATVCGRTGTFQTVTGERRADTDWYEIVADGTHVRVTLTGEVPLRFFALAPTCEEFRVLAQGSTRACRQETFLLRSIPGQRYWLWVGPQGNGFGIPECSYVMNVCGIRPSGAPGRSSPSVSSRTQQEIPRGGVERSTWGRIKATYQE
jgi:hypothetical protein